MTLRIEAIIDSNTASQSAGITCRESIESHGGLDIPVTTASRDTADQVFLDPNVDVFIVTAPTHVWTADTLAIIVAAFRRNPDLDVLYGPEDVGSGPSSWAPERLRMHDYLGGIVAISGRVGHQLVGIRTDRYPHHRWDLAFRATEVARRIEVATTPLATRVSNGARFANPECVRRGNEVLNDHLTRVRSSAGVHLAGPPTDLGIRPVPTTTPKISLVIPSMASNHPTVGSQLARLGRVLDGLPSGHSDRLLETLVITGSGFPTAIGHHEPCRRLAVKILPLCRDHSMKWRYLDAAASHAAGDVVVVVDDDVVIESPDWLETLCAIALEPRIGAVCATATDITFPVSASPAGPEGPLIVPTSTAPSGCIAMRREIFVRMSGLLDDATGSALPLLLRRRDLACVTTGHARFHRIRELAGVS